MNFQEKLMQLILKDAKKEIEIIEKKYKQEKIECEKCKETIKYLKEYNKNRTLESYEEENALEREEYFTISKENLKEQTMLKELRLINQKTKHWITIFSHDDWNSFAYIKYCDECFNFYEEEIYKILGDETEDNQEITIRKISEYEKESYNALEKVFIIKQMSKIEEAIKKMELKENIYVYDRIEYDLGIDPLWSFETEEQRKEFIKDDKEYKLLTLNEEEAMRMNVSNSIKWETSGLARLLVDEKDLEISNTGMYSGLSGYISGIMINIEKDKVKEIEFYDTKEKVWVNHKSEKMKKLIENNKRHLSKEENLEKYRKAKREKDLIDEIYEFYNENKKETK